MTKQTSTTKAQLTKLESFTTTSAKIRYLDQEGWTRGQISKYLGIRYQWVRNVLVTPVTQPRES